FLPGCTGADLAQAARKAQANGGFTSACADLPALPAPADLQGELAALNGALFDANVEPTATAKTPPPGKDIIQASSNTFYRGVTLQDLKAFREQHPLNSRVVKAADGAIHEEVWRAGTTDGSVPPGLYAVYLKEAIRYLEK